MRSVALAVAHAILVCLAVLVGATTARADVAPDEVALGIAARSANPPDLAAARAHFEAAAAGKDDRAAAEGLYFLGDMDDADLHFASALARYEASAARLPSCRYTPRANSRAHELRTHAEGSFAPLVELETVRRSVRLANDADAIDRLVRDADGFPPGKVRVEARMLAAEAYRGRLARPDEQIPLLRQVVADPNADVLLARSAASELLQAYVRKNDLAAALDVATTDASKLPPKSDRAILRLMRRRPLRAVALSDLALLVVFALLAFARPGRKRAFEAVRRVTPMAIGFAALACGVGGLLASRYEQTSPYPFGAIFPAMVVVALLSRAWSAVGSNGVAARGIRGVAAFVAVFAVAFLLLDHMDPIYLAGFGL